MPRLKTQLILIPAKAGRAKGVKRLSLTVNFISRVILDHFYGIAEFMIQNSVGKSFIKDQGVPLSSSCLNFGEKMNCKGDSHENTSRSRFFNSNEKDIYLNIYDK